ncbi:MAG: TetR/AcrR family transcriptional regulator [Acidimicrobiia bacterium]|nr:TetR/AcrR family transcriptional regulator [Acidimicrobiia bacterium]
MAQATVGEDQAPATTRDRILAAAAEVFAERGYEGAAVSDIARRAGFTTGAIYGRFRDKAELLLEVVRGVLESQQEAAVLAAAGGDNAVSSRFAELVGEFVDTDREASRALVLEAHVAARRDDTVGALLRNFQSERLAALRDLVSEAQTRGEVAADLDPTTVATLFLAIPLGIVLLDTAGVDVPGADTWAEVARQTAISLRPTKES